MPSTTRKRPALRQRSTRSPARARPSPDRFPVRGRRSAIGYATGLLWVAVIVVWGSGGLRAGGSVVFWLVASAALVHLVAQAVRTVVATEPFRSAAAIVALVTVAGVVVAFDPVTLDTFNVTKLAVLSIGGAVLLGVVSVEWAVTGRFPFRRSPLDLPVLALAAWTVLTTLTSSNVRTSVLGVYGSYHALAASLGLVVLFFGAVRAFRLADLRRVISVLWYAVGGLAMLYGLFQLHDRVWGGTWDWVRWGAADFGASIWSTLGNPNHLAGLLAILLPLGIALFVLTRNAATRVLIGTMTALLLFELLYTEGRGGWLGSALALAVMASFFGRELLARPRLLVAGGVALVVAVGASVAVFGDRVDLGERVTTAFELGEGTTAQRFGQWEAAVEMAAKRPVTGFGPETFRLHFNRFQAADFVEQFGADNTTAGSHNLFTDHAAMLGLPGLALFVWLLGASAQLLVRARRALRVREAAGEQVDGLDPRTARVLLAAVSAALVAYVAQASFNLQQMALSALFWLLLALAVTIGRAVASEHADGHGEPAPRRRLAVVAPTAVLVVAGIVAVAVVASIPWRADRDYRAARIARNQALSAVETAHAPALFDRAAAGFDRAIATNRWEPVYLADSAQLRLAMASVAERLDADPRVLVAEAVDRYRRAVELRPQAFELLAGYAGALLALDAATEGGDPEAVARAVAVLEDAVRRSPHSERLRSDLEEARARARN